MLHKSLILSRNATSVHGVGSRRKGRLASVGRQAVALLLIVGVSMVACGGSSIDIGTPIGPTIPEGQQPRRSIESEFCLLTRCAEDMGLKMVVTVDDLSERLFPTLTNKDGLRMSEVREENLLNHYLECGGVTNVLKGRYLSNLPVAHQYQPDANTERALAYFESKTQGNSELLSFDLTVLSLVDLCQFIQESTECRVEPGVSGLAKTNWCRLRLRSLSPISTEDMRSVLEAICRVSGLRMYVTSRDSETRILVEPPAMIRFQAIQGEAVRQIHADGTSHTEEGPVRLYWGADALTNVVRNP